MNSEQLYKVISFTEYLSKDEFIFNKLKIHQHEIEVIKDYSLNNNLIFCKEEDNTFVYLDILLESNQTEIEIFFFKLSDDYFYLRQQITGQNISCYECDQLHGLIECLKMLKSKYELI
jgi:hypothetical protein